MSPPLQQEPPEKKHPDPGYNPPKSEAEYRARRRAAVAKRQLKKKLQFAREKRAFQSSPFFVLALVGAITIYSFLYVLFLVFFTLPIVMILDKVNFQNILAFPLFWMAAVVFHLQARRFRREVRPYFRKSASD